MVYDNVLEAMGRTPLIRLNRPARPVRRRPPWAPEPLCPYPACLMRASRGLQALLNTSMTRGRTTRKQSA